MRNPKNKGAIVKQPNCKRNGCSRESKVVACDSEKTIRLYFCSIDHLEEFIEEEMDALFSDDDKYREVLKKIHQQLIIEPA